MRYRVVADKVWRRSAMHCLLYLLYTRRKSRDGHVTGERWCVGRSEVGLEQEEVSFSDLSASKSRVKRGVLSCGAKQARS